MVDLKEEQKNDKSSELQNLVDGVAQDYFQITAGNIDELFEFHETLEKKLMCFELGRMSIIWNSFIEMAQILLGFISLLPQVISHYTHKHLKVW